jgi:hypothetical protein
MDWQVDNKIKSTGKHGSYQGIASAMPKDVEIKKPL